MAARHRVGVGGLVAHGDGGGAVRRPRALRWRSVVCASRSSMVRRASWPEIRRSSSRMCADCSITPSSAIGSAAAARERALTFTWDRTAEHDLVRDPADDGGRPRRSPAGWHVSARRAERWGLGRGGYAARPSLRCGAVSQTSTDGSREGRQSRLWHAAQEVRDGGRIVEIGSFRGRSTTVLGSAARPVDGGDRDRPARRR